MHFWIDKRSSYGIGHNHHRGISPYHQNQFRRIRSKSIVTPQIRQHPIPSTSSQHAKSHHRNRHTESDQQRLMTIPRIQQHSTTAGNSPAVPNVPMHLNQQHIPVIHSVYPRDDLPVVLESSESTRSNAVINHWLPIQIICVICIILSITLVILKLYFDNEMSELQLLSFGLISIAFLFCTTIISILRMRKNQLILQGRIQNEIFTETVMSNNQLDTPPPYNIAIKHSSAYNNRQSSPPPSYDKINII
jgi:hypothetical protein